MKKNGLPPNIANNRPIPEIPGAYRIKELQITIGKIGYLPYIQGWHEIFMEIFMKIHVDIFFRANPSYILNVKIFGNFFSIQQI